VDDLYDSQFLIELFILISSPAMSRNEEISNFLQGTSHSDVKYLRTPSLTLQEMILHSELVF